MRKITIITAMLLAALAITLTTHAAEEAEAFSVSGKVEFAKKGSETWMPLAKGVLVSPGYTVRTGAAGNAVIRWFDGNAVKVGPSSLFIITKLSKSGNSEKSSLELTKGSVYIRAKKASAGESTFEVKTPTAVAGVRGTEFLAETADAGKTTFAVSDGQITVEAQSITVVIDPNYMISVEQNQPPGEIFSISAELKTRMQTDSQAVKQAATAPTSSSKKEEKKETKKEKKETKPKKEEKKPEPKPVKTPDKKPATDTTTDAAVAVETAADMAIETIVDNVLHQDVINIIVDDVVTPVLNCCTQ